MSERDDLPSAAQMLLVEFHANWLPVSEVRAAGQEAAEGGFTGFIHFPAPLLTPQQEADFRARWRACFAAAEGAEAAGSPEPHTGAEGVPEALSPAEKVEKWALRGAASDPRPDKSDWIRIWALARAQVGQPTDAQEWESALLAAENAPVPAPEPVSPPVQTPPYPFRDGTERSLAQRQTRIAWDEVQRLERYIQRLDDPLLLGYAGVASATLEHLARALEQSPNPYPLDPEIIAKGDQP